tara:strand:+ start:64 stop:729 length:666 start_codon:yes stop_codon:yes gene_type:complete
MPGDFEEITRVAGRKFSCERQDEFICHLLASQPDYVYNEPGYFLDIACGHPKDASNTYILENYYNWEGIGFDIGDVETDCDWSKHRESPFYQVDATTSKLTDLLKEHSPKEVDYISLDVDGTTNLSAPVLERILDADIEFKAMTLEHEAFKYGRSICDATRAMLLMRGYVMLFEDVSFEDGTPWEDWWIKEDSIPIENIMDISKKGATYNQCIESLAEFIN